MVPKNSRGSSSRPPEFQSRVQKNSERRAICPLPSKPEEKRSKPSRATVRYHSQSRRSIVRTDAIARHYWQWLRTSHNTLSTKAIHSDTINRFCCVTVNRDLTCVGRSLSSACQHHHHGRKSTELPRRNSEFHRYTSATPSCTSPTHPNTPWHHQGTGEWWRSHLCSLNHAESVKNLSESTSNFRQLIFDLRRALKDPTQRHKRQGEY